MRLGLWKSGSVAPSADKAALARVKEMVRTLLALSDDVTVSVNEIVCADPACPGSETIILVMAPGQRTKAYKVQMQAADVTDEAIRSALGA